MITIMESDPTMHNLDLPPCEVEVYCVGPGGANVHGGANVFGNFFRKFQLLILQ